MWVGRTGLGELSEAEALGEDGVFAEGVEDLGWFGGSLGVPGWIGLCRWFQVICTVFLFVLTVVGGRCPFDLDEDLSFQCIKWG